MSADTEPVRLELGRPVVRDLAGGGSHEYLVRVEEGQYLRLTAEQRGIDVKLRLLPPAGDALIRDVDSPTGDQGPETLSIIAEVAGEYRARVVADDKEKPGQYEIRIEDLRKATDQDRTRVAAEVVFLEGEDLRRKKDPQAALARYGRALEIWRSLGDQGGEARALYQAGQMHERLGDTDPALQVYDQAREKYHLAEDTRSEAMVLNRRGTLLRDLERVDEALASYTAALKIADSHGHLRVKLSALNNIGLIHMYAGRTSLAIEDSLHEASRIANRLDDVKNEARIQINLGLLFFNQNRPDDARDALEAARQAAEQAEERESLAVALGYLGEIDQRGGRLAEARSELESALEIQREQGDEDGQTASLASLGTTLLKAGDLEGAWKVTQEALALSRKLAKADNEAIALSNLGRIHHARGEDKDAVALQREARALFERIADRQGMATVRFGAARSLARLGDLPEARRELETALDLVEELRNESPGLDFRASFFASKQHYWDLYLDILMRLGERDPAKKEELTVLALQTAERRRARSLLDALAGTRETLESKADPQVAEEIREVEQRLSLAEARRARAIEAGAEPGILKASESEVRSLLTRQDLLRARLRDRNSRLAELSRPAPLDIEAIQRLLDANTLLLVYSLGEERSYLWTVSERSVVSYVLAERERIETAARQLAENLPRSSQEGQASAQRSAAALSSLVLDPAAERISSFRRLLVVADGALQSVPFAALPDPAPASGEPGAETVLVEGHEVIYLPSASVLAPLRQRASRGRKPAEELRVAVIADPAFRAGGGADVAMTRSLRHLGLSELKPLPYARQEAESILAMLKRGRPFSAFGFDATRDLFTAGRLRDYHIVHIATHSLMDSRQPELSGIAFSMVDAAGTPRDGFLRLHEIYNLDLEADLVVLSACQTGVGQEVRGEGLLGIARGFLYAGVPQLVVSLWKVDDRSTAELMKRFYYQLLEEGHPPAEALRRAQVSMLRDSQWSHPRHWAGFIFIGDFQLKPGGGIEEEDTGGTVVAKKATSDLPPPKVAPDRPKKPRPPRSDS